MNNKQKNNHSVFIEELFNASVTDVWNAITDKTEMKKWYFDIPEFKPFKGCEFQFYGGTEKRSYLHLCKITEVAENKKLSHTWSYDGIQGETILTFEIFPEKEKTRLKLSHSGFETFPKDNPDLAIENFQKGWDFIIGTSLKGYLEQTEN